MSQIRFDDQGLAPCVMQDARTGEVLTLAYMNAEAVDRTRETREVHFWSRSRAQLWRKGETSGNVMRLRALRWDCDADALLALVDPAGPACHTGERSCFHAGDTEPVEHEAMATLERTIGDRQLAISEGRTGGSYTAELLGDPHWIAEKVREEAEEVARAAIQESEQRVAEEAADLLYHVAVLLASRGMSFDAAYAALNDRRG